MLLLAASFTQFVVIAPRTGQFYSVSGHSPFAGGYRLALSRHMARHGLFTTFLGGSEMRRNYLLAVAAVMVFQIVATGAKCRAAVILSLSYSSNPLQWSVGESITFGVKVSGIAAGRELDSLAATVDFDGSTFSLPEIAAPTIAQGGVVPDPLADPFDFRASATTGQADATFLTFSALSSHHIVEDGIFFTFQTKALKAGVGQIAIDQAYATYFNPDSPERPLPTSVETGARVSYSVVPAPEPSSGIMLLAAVVLGGGWRCLRRR